MNEYFANADQYKNVTENIQASPRKEFIYVNDDGAVVAIRLGQWKSVFLENRADAFQIVRDPLVNSHLPILRDAASQIGAL
ncbi:MAG: hypothetical protein CMJ77_08245 [Planctomycetaceae bacterium]|nr:hypothetical protein [Planctomycetaceae bacterium]